MTPNPFPARPENSLMNSNFSLFKSQTTGEHFPPHSILVDNNNLHWRQGPRTCSPWKCHDYFDWSMNISLVCFLIVFFLVFVGVALLAL